MKRALNGFSLLELMLTIVLFAVLLSIAIPQYQNRLVIEEMKNAVSEIEGMILDAKSLAMSTGESLWIDVESSSSGWQVTLHHHEQYTSPDILHEVSGSFYPHIVLTSGLKGHQLKIDGQTGKPGQNAHLKFFRRKLPEAIVQLLISNGAGRVRSCSVGEAAYGYPSC